jgi:hypothetical protein
MSDLIERLREEVSTYKGGARHTQRYKLMKYAADELERLTAERDARPTKSGYALVCKQRDAARKLIADAPHGEDCASLIWACFRHRHLALDGEYDCDCWKSREGDAP